MRILDCIGRTPLVRLDRLGTPSGVRLLAKLEGTNPGGSVKDRAALSMIAAAEADGTLRPGMRIVEPTSGNTGIALAMIGRVRGYEVELVMPESATAERVLSMRAYGATVSLTPADRSMEGSIDLARERVQDGAVMLDQFSNPANPLAHERTTGPEIWRQTRGRVTHFVSAMGTTGTIMGVSAALKRLNPAVTVIGVQPADGACIPGIRRWPAAYLPRVYEPSRVDALVDVTAEEAAEVARRLARDEGVFCGVSGGGATAAALRLCATLDQGVVVVILPDRGDRYLSSDLFQ